MHDPRVGRFFAIDPLAPKYPHNSPYAFSENRVIDATELEGLESKTIHRIKDQNGNTKDLYMENHEVNGPLGSGELYIIYNIDKSILNLNNEEFIDLKLSNAQFVYKYTQIKGKETLFVTKDEFNEDITFIDKVMGESYLPIYKSTQNLEQKMINRITNLIEISTKTGSDIDLRKCIESPSYNLNGKERHNIVGGFGFTGSSFGFAGKINAFDKDNNSVSINLTIKTFITSSTSLESEELLNVGPSDNYKTADLPSKVAQPYILQIGNDKTGLIITFESNSDRSLFINTYLEAQDKAKKAEEMSNNTNKD